MARSTVARSSGGVASISRPALPTSCPATSRATTRRTSSSCRAFTARSPNASRSTTSACVYRITPPSTASRAPATLSSRLLTSLAAKHFARGALARAHGAVHVPDPERGRLGASPVDLAHRPAQRRAVLVEDSRRREADRAAARPDLLAPVLLEVALGLERLRPVVVGEVLEHRAAPRGLGPVRPHTGVVPADEAEHHAGLAVARARVEGRARRSHVGHGLARQVVVAPERRRVDRLALDERALRHPLDELCPLRGQLRVVLDLPCERRR